MEQKAERNGQWKIIAELGIDLKETINFVHI